MADCVWGGRWRTMRDMTASDAYRNFIDELRAIALLGSTLSLLGWDERVNLPPNGAEHRANQSAYLAKLIHERFTSPRVGEWLAAVESSELVKDAESDAAVNARETRRAYDRATKLPAALVEELTRTSVLSEQAWEKAKKASDYAQFKPWLGKVLDLKRQEAECYGYKSKPYDALLDTFEPGATSEQIAAVFESLRGPLVELIGKVARSGKTAPADVLRRHYPVAQQQQFSREVATAIGYDFDSGRLDASVHPFSIHIGPGDARITTRYDDHDFANAFFSTIHECGHAMYNLGLPPEHYGTPRGEDLSLGIHESQSRMWENLVGRSRPFWRHFFPRAKAMFPDALADVTDDQWYFAINGVQPSFIRTESDETTYNLHVLLRFELEQALLHRDLSVDDLPGAWNERMRKYFNLTPPNDREGCLQDVHWAGGAIGYFPTYTLGNLYAAQFFEQARKDLGDLDAMFARGEFAPLLGWLRTHIHAQGKRFTPAQLVTRITGKPLSPEPLLRHLRAKARELYGVD
jgi:carboxypeptidase Taq